MKTKIRVFFLFLMLIFIAGCGEKKPEISAQDYNNQLLSLQEAALIETKQYYTALDSEYNGQNLKQLYEDLQNNLSTLANKAEISSGFGNDQTLKNAVVNYITGLQEGLEKYEKPVVNLITQYTGSSLQFYSQDQSLVSSGTMALAQHIATLDAQLDQIQTSFFKKYKIISSQ